MIHKFSLNWVFILLLSPLASSACASGALAEDGGPTIEVSQRVIEIQGGINFKTMKAAQTSLLTFASQGSAPIWIRINSGGGSVDAGLILIDTMKAVEAPIYCVVESSAYSMAAIILSYCDRRYGLPHATFMLHEASYGTSGEDPTNRSKLDFLSRYLDRMHEEIADNIKMDKDKYRKRIRDAWWLLADEALDIGLIDQIVEKIEHRPVTLVQSEEKQTITYTKEVELPRDDSEQKTEVIPKRKD